MAEFDSYITWFIAGLLIVLAGWLLADKVPNKRITRLLRTVLLVIIFMPVVYLGHPFVLEPVWYTIWADPSSAPVAVLLWIVPIIILEGIFMFRDYFGRRK